MTHSDGFTDADVTAVEDYLYKCDDLGMTLHEMAPGLLAAVAPAIAARALREAADEIERRPDVNPLLIVRTFAAQAAARAGQVTE